MRKRQQKFWWLFLIVALVGSLYAQETTKLKAPYLPKEMSDAERNLLTQVSLQLAKGEFDQAQNELKALMPPSTVRIYVNWIPVPKAKRAEYQKAIQDAIAAWNRALTGSLQFQVTEREEDAEILLLFEREVALTGGGGGQFRLACSDWAIEMPFAPSGSNPAIAGGLNNPTLPSPGGIPKAGNALPNPDQPANSQANPTKRTAQLWIALKIPYSEMIHSPISITHLVAQGLGGYLGLGADTQNLSGGTGVMSPDWHNNNLPTQPSESEVQTARQIQEARLKLMEYATKRVTIFVPRPTILVEKTEYDAGDVMRGENPRYVIKIKNTGEAPLEIDAKPNCGCIVPTYDKVIEAGAEGKIEAEIRTTGYRGRIVKAIDIRTNDLEHPSINVRLMANIVPAVQVTPSETMVLALKDNEPTTAQFEIEMKESEGAEISRVSCTVPYASAKVEPVENGRKYKLTVTVQPEAPLGRAAFLVTAYTTSKREPQVNLSISCEKGIITTPVSVYIGTITQSTQLPVQQVVTLVKRSGTFHITKIESDDPNLEIRQETLQDGSQYRLVITYRGGWTTTGSVRRVVGVQTDDPKQSKIEIPVLATVVGNPSN